jgi:hypothetical protein
LPSSARSMRSFSCSHRSARSCGRPIGTEQVTEASTVYEFIGLSESGNAEIGAMSQDDYDQKMARWTRWINACLTG